jgi:protein phosphatase PTC2/3
MGNRPCTIKEYNEGSNGTMQFVACAMKGWRDEMEDFHCVHLNMQGRDMSLFAVYDGHGGKDVANYASISLHKLLLNDDYFCSEQFEAGLKASFIKLDHDVKYTANIACEYCGSTAVACLVIGRQLYCANVGDSRAVLCRNGKALDLSKDHKPRLPSERKRIEQAGGNVAQNRVNGLLSMSRAIGDHAFKMCDLPLDQQQVTDFQTEAHKLRRPCAHMRACTHYIHTEVIVRAHARTFGARARTHTIRAHKRYCVSECVRVHTLRARARAHTHTHSIRMSKCACVHTHMVHRYV